MKIIDISFSSLVSDSVCLHIVFLTFLTMTYWSYCPRRNHPPAFQLLKEGAMYHQTTPTEKQQKEIVPSFLQVLHWFAFTCPERPFFLSLAGLFLADVCTLKSDRLIPKHALFVSLADSYCYLPKKMSRQFDGSCMRKLPSPQRWSTPCRIDPLSCSKSRNLIPLNPGGLKSGSQTIGLWNHPQYIKVLVYLSPTHHQPTTNGISQPHCSCCLLWKQLELGLGMRPMEIYADRALVVAHVDAWWWWSKSMGRRGPAWQQKDGAEPGHETHETKKHLLEIWRAKSQHLQGNDFWGRHLSTCTSPYRYAILCRCPVCF